MFEIIRSDYLPVSSPPDFKNQDQTPDADYLNYLFYFYEYIVKDPAMTDQVMKQILTTSYGCNFYDKLRSKKIPEPNIETVDAILGKEFSPTFWNLWPDVCDFLDGQIITDTWGNNHTGRKAWRVGMRDLYGESFLRVYEWPNQLRSGSINVPSGLLGTIEFYSKTLKRNRPLFRKLVRIRERIDEKIGISIGVDYAYYNKSVDEKSQSVRFTIDSTIEAADLLYGADSHRSMLVT